MFQLKKNSFIFVPVLAVLLLFSCNAKDEAAVEPKPNEAVVDDVSENVNMEMDESLLAEKSLEKVKYDSSLQVGFAKKQSAPSAHQKYLKDKLVFKAFPFNTVQEGTTAVVGSDLCLFYPNAELKSQEDLKKLPAGIPVPFGTVLSIEEEPVRLPFNADDEFDFGVFKFQENQNYFYQTTWNGEKGLVFGADLAGIGNDLKINQAISMRLLFYTHNDKPHFNI